jgi:hypothetical protein
MPETPTERALHAQQASLLRWSKVEDRAAAMRPQREGLERKWTREIDPNGQLSPQELARRLEMRRKAHMAEMTRKSVKSRRERAARKS